MSDFKKLSYLESGTPKQRAAYQLLIKYNIMESLTGFDPILVGTVPIAIDIPGSDLDIVACFENSDHFIGKIKNLFGDFDSFHIREQSFSGIITVIANFHIGEFEVELFGQPIPTEQQNAYRHLLIESEILQIKGEDFKQQIIRLKQNGMKTEPAFAKLLGLSGDPYRALLDYKI